ERSAGALADEPALELSADGVIMLG
ncbi:MAG: hypothetical protein JWM18_2176, partial [Chloroflexi bacterium]|nr:hypothetical protein [Chloroflexota bacterium]